MPISEPLLIAGMAAVTFAVRYPVLALVSRVKLPQVILDAMKFIPPAVLTAIVVPAVAMPQGQFDISLDNAYLVAGIVSAAIAWRTRNLLWTILLGMGIFLLYKSLIGMWGA